jgi:hypothetical protein
MTHEILLPNFERIDHRGTFQEVFNRGTWSCLICGAMKPDSVMGNHYHKKTIVFFFLRTGKANITTQHVESKERECFMLETGQGVILRTYEAHNIRFLDDSDFIMLKSLPYDSADPDTFHFDVKE